MSARCEAEPRLAPVGAGSIQEWTIENARNPLERWMHSFHIHVNNFQVSRAF